MSAYLVKCIANLDHFIRIVLKVALAIILDVGPAMSQAAPGHETPLETSVKAIKMILTRKVRN